MGGTQRELESFLRRAEELVERCDRAARTARDQGEHGAWSLALDAALAATRAVFVLREARNAPPDRAPSALADARRAIAEAERLVGEAERKLGTWTRER